MVTKRQSPGLTNEYFFACSLDLVPVSHQFPVEQAASGTTVNRNWPDWVGLIARLILGVALTYAGAIKVGNLNRNVYQVQLYQLPLPQWFEIVVGYAQPFVEIAVGVMLIVGLFTRVNAILGVLAMVVFIFGISWAWAKGLRIDCGCFTPGGVLDPEEETRYVQDILRDIGFMICGLWLAIRPKTPFAVDNWLFKPVTVDLDELTDEELAELERIEMSEAELEPSQER